MKCNGKIKVKQGRSVKEYPCPHNKWRCELYTVRPKKGEPMESRSKTNCKHYSEYYDWT